MQSADLKAKNRAVDFDRAVNLGNGIWWVGFQDLDSGLRCNPYLIIEGDEAVLIDGGSRPDFPVVMLKILETGLHPGKIVALIYDHYDPDLCGSIPNLEEMIANPELKLISSGFSHTFIRHYGTTSKFVKVSELGYRFVFKTGRVIEFVCTPYCHSRGSFVTFDHQSRILFSGDIFGTFASHWKLFLEMPADCKVPECCYPCHKDRSDCPLPGYLDFHRMTMPSTKALHYSLRKIRQIPFSMVAPQHGSVLSRDLAELLIRIFEQSSDIGIDQIQPEE